MAFKVAIIGGGYAGFELAKALDSHVEVTVIEAREAFVEVVDWMAAEGKANPGGVYAGSVPYLMLAGNLMAGWQMARALMVAEDRLADGDEPGFMRAKIGTPRSYADHVLSRVPGQRDSIVAGAESVMSMPLEAF